MAELSLKIVTDEGAVTRMIKFDADMKVAHVYPIIKDKMHHMGNENDYGLFLPSVNDSRSGTWLAPQRTLQHYMLHDGDSLLLLNKSRNLRVKMLDGVVKTLQVDESKNINDLIHIICGKVGITNHDEYGLCHEEMEQDDFKEPKPATGTLTLKRKPQRERDAKMEQLSKKLKTDDNVEWLDQHKTLREIGVDHSETLILKRRLFYTDRNVDSRDPKQLNMLYNENKAAILEGKHPVTEEQAINFAAIQCQVNFGDYNEEKHKPGFIEDLREYLPEHCTGLWSAEKRIVKLYRKYQGLSQLEAMHLYNKTARELPTYGVTFFLVKEKHSKGKNKLMSCLLGINSESILRLDVETKEILQEWPITHVKTYHASKNETFMLDFGDYSDKPYSVKTTDAYRIRDILEGYIDMIRKKMMGNHNVHCADSGAVVQDEVHPSRGNTMTHVSAGPNKIVEHSFVGPSRIIPFEQGSKCQQGTQMMTVQQVIITNKGSQQQQIISGGVPMRSDISKDLMMKLNRLNSNAVKIVTFLSDPTEDNIKKVRTSLETIEEELPAIETGVKNAAEKQSSEDAKKKLLKELEELLNLCATMTRDSKTSNLDVPKMDENAKKLADLTTQIVFAVDPRAQGRIRSLRNSRKSFIQDEKMEATLRRASFLTAADGATGAVQGAIETLDQKYTGPPLTDQELDRLEASAIDKLGKLNAAVALFLNAHADPANIDYAAAVNSMNTIKELLPKLARDMKALSEASDADSREALLDEVRTYCEAARKVCTLTGCDDHEKLQDAANQYADISGRLLYTFGGRNPRVNADKENEIVDLAREVGIATGALLVVANGVVEAAGREGNDPAAAGLDAAGVQAALAARDLLTCAQVSAPTIHEPHCRSALSAAAEHVATRAQQLALAWRPLVQDTDNTRVAGELTSRSIALAEALDRLKRAYVDIEERKSQREEPSPAEAARLRFITSVSPIKSRISDAHKLLDEPVKPAKLSESQINALQDSISQKLGQTNAAVAALLEAKSDSQNPDYKSAELAIKTISELLPDVIQDAKSLVSSCPDDVARRVMLNDVRAWCDGIDGLCDSFTEHDKKCLQHAAKNYARASKKLSFAFSPRARKAREQLMLELFDSAHRKAMDLVDDTNKMADTIGGANGVRLRDLGSAVEDEANSLRTTLLVSAPSLSESQCRSALANRSGQLNVASSLLADAANSLQDDETGCRILAAKLQEQRANITSHADELSRALEAIRATLDDATPVVVEAESPSRAVQRLKFASSASAAKQKAEEAAKILDQPYSTKRLTEQEAKALQDKLAKDLTAANSSVATLIRAKSDRQHPDYEAAELALKIVSDLLPTIINDSKAYSTTFPHDSARAAKLQDILQAWCNAVHAVCATAHDDDLKEFVDSAQQFADSSNKLRFVVRPEKMPAEQQKVLQLSNSACKKAKVMSDETEAASAAIGGETVTGASLALSRRALDTAARALQTTAQLTAPSLHDPNSRTALIASTDTLASSAKDLVSEAKSRPEQRAKDLGDDLEIHRKELDDVLGCIKVTCDEHDANSPANQARLKFVKGIAKAQDELKTAKTSLDHPLLSVKLSDQQNSEVKDRLAHDVAHVNAAIASLILAKCDSKNPDYAAADQAVLVISKLIPKIVKDTKTLASNCKDKAAQKEIIQNTCDWFDSIQGICSSAHLDDAKELDKAAQKLVIASNKLQFTVGSRKNPIKEQEVLSQCGAVCELALSMSADGGGAAPQRAAAVAAKARTLHTTAMLTAPSIDDPRSLHTILSSCDALSEATKSLVTEVQSSSDPGNKILGQQLQMDQQQLEKLLDGLKDNCTGKKLSPAVLKEQRLKFVSSASAAQNKAQEVKALLDQPINDTKLTEQEAKDKQERLSRAMAQINAALASLISAKSDPNQPDYVTADKSLGTITEMLPEVVKETREMSRTCADESSRAAMLQDIRAWCDAVHAVCATAHDDDVKALNESALKLSDSTQKLRFIFSASKNPVKEQQILQLSSSACDKAHQMAKETQRMVSVTSSAEAELLQQRAVALDDAATALHTTTQLTLPSINEPQCRAALVTAADSMSHTAEVLVKDIARAAHPAARRVSEECDRYRIVMERALDSLRAVVLAEDTRGKSRPPPVPVKRSSLSKEGKAGRVRVVSHSDVRRASQEWLDHMRHDASLDLEASSQAPPGLSAKDIQALTKRADEERAKRDNLAKALDNVERNMAKLGQELNEIGGKKFTGTELDADQKKGIQTQMEQKLALAGIAASKFMNSNHPDEMDYAAGAQHADDLSELVSDIVKDATQLSNTSDQKYRNGLLDQIRALCEATRRLARTATKDNEKLSEAAVEFGEKSAKLVYLISEESNPEQEKGVITLAKAIGESAIRLADRGTVLLTADGASHDRERTVCTAGRNTAATAAQLVYTAKLVAPFVHHQQCQNALISSSHELSSSLKQFSQEFKAFSTDPKLSHCVTEMSTESANLEKLLESFRHDLAAGKLVKRREVEEIEVDNTALRCLAAKIMDVAQLRADSSNLADDKKNALSEYAGQLRDAIAALDRAQTRTKRAPLDLKRRRDLENAVQNLQITLLQSRPSLEDKPSNNIVDLTDFVRETTAEAYKLLSTASNIVDTEDETQLHVIKEESQKINNEAFNVLSPSERGGEDDNSVDDIADVDQFGEDCEVRIRKMGSAMESMKEENKTKLAGNMLALTESCSMLRFAAKSALSTAQSAALDETLEDLIDLEKRLDQILTPLDGDLVQKDSTLLCEEENRCRWRVMSACGALSRAHDGKLPTALLAYTTTMRRRDIPTDRLKAHALRLIELSKLLTAAVGNRVAMWQKLACPEVADITRHIYKELENPEISSEPTADKDYIPILTAEDIQKALTPTEYEPSSEDPNESIREVQQSACRLVSMVACSGRGAHSAVALRRAAPAVISAVAQLVWQAEGQPAKTLAQKKRIQESCQEMQWSTFGLLVAAETVSRQPTCAAAKQRLHAQQRSLCEVVNKLIREVSSNSTSSEVQLSCNEATRTLQARCSPQPAALSALPYSDCLHTLVEQRDVLEKLESKEPMSRVEFSKSLSYVTAAVSNSTECAAHCAYLLSISESNKVAAKEGLVDVARLHKLSAAVNDVCMRIMRTTDVEMAKEEETKLRSLCQELTSSVKSAGGVCTEPSMKRELTEIGFKIELAATELSSALVQDQPSAEKNLKCCTTLVDRLSALNGLVERPGLVPVPGDMADDTRMLVDDVMNHSQKLVSKTQALLKDIKNSPDDEPMTWVTFNTSRKSLLEAFDQLLRTIRQNGEQAGLVEAAETEKDDEDAGDAKGYLEQQEERARVWLVEGRLPRAGQEACNTIIELAKLLGDDVSGTEKEDLDSMVCEAEKLLEQCTKKYNKKTASTLMSVIRSLRRLGCRCVAARVVDDFLASEVPLQDLEIFLDAEKDDARRKYLLEQKIAELLAQLGRTSRTARLAARATPRPQLLDQCREKTELLAPALVKAAEERMARPSEQCVVDNYRRLLAQYAESLAQVQEMCDTSVAPMDFVQAAGETMSRMREESSRDNNPQMCAYTSAAITRLANRVIVVSMSSPMALADPALAAALAEAAGKLAAAAPPPGARASAIPDWNTTTEQILRTTGEVESALGGENIFKKQREPDQPIYNAALNLHEAVRGWSARDNEIVAVAKRMAVLMARLADQMYTDRKRELIATSKSIVTESCEVAELAKKLALECTDIRIRTNLLNVCERIPTISAQLKMLTAVKATSLANHGGEDDREGMNMIVGNAQNLMSSVQEVVKVAASASVKIASQRGLKWVRRNY